MDELEFEGETLDLATSSDDPVLLPILRGYAREMLVNVGTATSHPVPTPASPIKDRAIAFPFVRV